MGIARLLLLFLFEIPAKLLDKYKKKHGAIFLDGSRCRTQSNMTLAPLRQPNNLLIFKIKPADKQQ